VNRRNGGEVGKQRANGAMGGKQNSICFQRPSEQGQKATTNMKQGLGSSMQVNILDLWMRI
jgi:hypothetical protein